MCVQIVATVQNISCVRAVAMSESWDVESSNYAESNIWSIYNVPDTKCVMVSSYLSIQCGYKDTMKKIINVYIKVLWSSCLSIFAWYQDTILICTLYKCNIIVLTVYRLWLCPNLLFYSISMLHTHHQFTPGWFAIELDHSRHPSYLKLNC